MRRFIAVDLETSGLDPERHEIIEVGVVGQGRVLESLREEFSLPFDEQRADPRALEINGYGYREFAPEASPAYVAGWLSWALYDAHIVGKNPSFDAGFLKALLERHGRKPTWHHRLVDVGALAWGHYNARHPDNPWPQPPNVDKVADLLGIPNEGLHTALGDAEWAWRVFRHVVPE